MLVGNLAKQDMQLKGKNKMINRLEIQEHGLMLSDYFCGTSGVMLPLYVYPKIKTSEVLEMLKDEINQIWDHIEYTAEYHEFKGDLEKDSDLELKRIQDFMITKGNQDNILFEDMKYMEEEENAVLIFSIEFLED